MIKFLVRAAGSLALAGAAVSCNHDAEVFMPPPADDIFRSYVAIGNSITAGYQSDGISNATQQQSYAFLLAQQMRTRFAYPALAGRGCAPPLTNWQTGARAGTGSTATTCDLRATTTTDILNNVAVPGAGSSEVNAQTSAFHNTLTTLFLGGKTQIQRAIDADPSFVTIWIGNNDVLQAAATGLVNATPGVSRGITPVATFTQNYDAMINTLTAGAPDIEGGVLIGTVQTSAAPLVFPVAVFQDAAYLGGFGQLAGGTVTVHPNCTGSGALVSFAIVAQMRSGAHPRAIVCQKNTPGFPAPVGDIFILDTDDQNAIRDAVIAYNNHIQQKATQLGWVFVDPNLLIAQLRAIAGCINPAPNIGASQTTSPFGTCISLDGVHPSAAGQARIANALIGAINTAYETSLPTVTVP